MKTYASKGNGYLTAAGLLIAFFVVLMVCISGGVYEFSQPGARHYTCGDFGSYSELVAFFPAGKIPTYLDGRDSDKIPCNTLYTKQYGKPK